MYAADVGNCMLLDLSDHANFEVQLVKKKRAIEKKNLNYNVKTDTNLIISVFLVFSFVLNLSANNDFLSFFDVFSCEFFYFHVAFFLFFFYWLSLHIGVSFYT